MAHNLLMQTVEIKVVAATEDTKFIMLGGVEYRVILDLDGQVFVVNKRRADGGWGKCPRQADYYVRRALKA